MALSFTDRKRVRKTFGRIAEVAQLPNLIEVQRESYAHFLQMYVKPDARTNTGLEAVFRSVFPITDFAETSRLEYVHYEFEEPKYDVDECRQRGMNYAAPLEGEVASHRVRGRSRNPGQVRQGHQGTRRLHGRPAAHDRARHVRHQRHRARHRQPDAPLARRLLRSRQRQDPLQRQVAVRRARHSLSRLVARFRIRRQGHHSRPHRPPPQAAGDDAAVRAWPDGRGNPGSVLPHGHLQGSQGRLDDAVRSGTHAHFEAGLRPEKRQDRRRRDRGRPQAHPARRAQACRRRVEAIVGADGGSLRPLSRARPASIRKPARSSPRPATKFPKSCSKI